MSHYFFDTSVLIKRYISETGTAWVRNTINPHAGHRIFAAEISVVEVVSGISRLKRESAISARTARAIRVLINRHMRREYDMVVLYEVILQSAQDLLEKHPLRAYDAIQLASAVDTHTKLISANLQPLIFVSADTRLLSAAVSEGVQVYHPV